jgi:hypothetical protein
MCLTPIKDFNTARVAREVFDTFNGLQCIYNWY